MVQKGMWYPIPPWLPQRILCGPTMSAAPGFWPGGHFDALVPQEASGIRVRADAVALGVMSDGQTLIESVLGTELFATGSVGSTPMRCENVAYQSATEM